MVWSFLKFKDRSIEWCKELKMSLFRLIPHFVQMRHKLSCGILIYVKARMLKAKTGHWQSQGHIPGIQTVYWILSASKGSIKQTDKKSCIHEITSLRMI